MNLQVGSVSYDRQPIADHASNLANAIQGNLKRSLEAIGVVSTQHVSAACSIQQHIHLRSHVYSKVDAIAFGAQLSSWSHLNPRASWQLAYASCAAEWI